MVLVEVDVDEVAERRLEPKSLRFVDARLPEIIASICWRLTWRNLSAADSETVVGNELEGVGADVGPGKGAFCV